MRYPNHYSDENRNRRGRRQGRTAVKIAAWVGAAVIAAVIGGSAAGICAERLFVGGTTQETSYWESIPEGDSADTNGTVT